MKGRYGLLAACLAVAIAAFPAIRSLQATSAPSARSEQPSRPILLDADEYGALVLDPGSQAVLGLGADGAVRWRDRRLAEREVSCLARCPDAVGSRSVMHGDRSIIWREGTATRTEPADTESVVLWARSPADALVARTDASGTSVLELRSPGAPPKVVPIKGRSPRLFPAPDGSGGTLLTFSADADGESQRWWLRRSRTGWTVSSPAAGRAWGACAGPQGQPLVLYGDQAFLQRTLAEQPHLLLAEPVGSCTVASRTILLQTFSQSSGSGTRTNLRLFGRSGRQLWQRDEPGIYQADLDPATNLTATLTGDEVLVVDEHGEVVFRSQGVTDAKFVATSCLAILHRDPDLRVTRQCLPHTTAE